MIHGRHGVARRERDACYRVENGLLKASVIAREGGERILAIFGPDSLVGELSTGCRGRPLSRRYGHRH
jgi:hypothetical protein